MLCRGFGDVPGRVGVADGGFVVDAEDGGEVKRVRPVGEGLVELAVDAESFEGGRLAAQRLGEPDLADGPVVERGALSRCRREPPRCRRGNPVKDGPAREPPGLFVRRWDRRGW
jgi:hypothetical protein